MNDQPENFPVRKNVRLKLFLFVLAFIGLAIAEITFVGDVPLIQKYLGGNPFSSRDFKLEIWSIILLTALALLLMFLATSVRLREWLFSWRGVRRILIVLAWTATIIALFYGEENWRGRRAWNKYRKELEAKGEVLDFKAFIPKPIPNEQNFAATPFIQSWFPRGGNEWATNYSHAEEMIPNYRTNANNGDRHFLNLVAYGRAFSAISAGQKLDKKDFVILPSDSESRAKAVPVILEGLKETEAALNELRAASQRPFSRYPL
ncbi:MAG: hypothetical protein ACR2H1_12135, partial [Limisphaerales bacterium]